MPHLKQRIFILMSPMKIGTLIQLDCSHESISQAEFETKRRVDDVVLIFEMPHQRIFIRQNNAAFGVLFDLFRNVWQNMTLQQIEQKRKSGEPMISIDMPPQSESQPLAPKLLEPQVVKLEISVDLPKPVKEVQRVERDHDGTIKRTVTDILY